MNTPSLGAATQTLSTLPDVAPDRLALPALAYAVTYPTAMVAGASRPLLLLKRIFRIDTSREAADFAATASSQDEPLERRTLLSRIRISMVSASKSIPGRSRQASPFPRPTWG